MTLSQRNPPLVSKECWSLLETHCTTWCHTFKTESFPTFRSYFLLWLDRCFCYSQKPPPRSYGVGYHDGTRRSAAETQRLGKELRMVHVCQNAMSNFSFVAYVLLQYTHLRMLAYRFCSTSCRYSKLLPVEVALFFPLRFLVIPPLQATIACSAVFLGKPLA